MKENIVFIIETLERQSMGISNSFSSIASNINSHSPSSSSGIYSLSSSSVIYSLINSVAPNNGLTSASHSYVSASNNYGFITFGNGDIRNRNPTIEPAQQFQSISTVYEDDEITVDILSTQDGVEDGETKCHFSVDDNIFIVLLSL